MIESSVWFGLGVIVASVIYLWPRKKEDKVILHGHDLAKWHFLGSTSCVFTDKDGEVLESVIIPLFVDKKDDKKRSFKILGSYKKYFEENHTYITRRLKPWACGEWSLHYLSTSRFEPSSYLKGYMMEKYNAEWDSANKKMGHE